MSVAIKHEYFPSCKYVINHDTTNCAAYDGIGNHLYSGRALGLSEPWDIIQLHPDLQPLWDDIRNHYSRIGLSHTDDAVWNLDLKYVASRIGYQPSVFYYGKNECKYWGDREWLETAEFINSKNNFVALANELGIEVPDTLRFESAFNIWTDDIKNIQYPCFLKAAVPNAGNMFKRFKNESQLLDAIADIPGDIPLQIQKEIKAESFINLQYQVIGNDLVRLAATEQILDGCVLRGNHVPASHEPWSAVEPMAEWLKDHGMKGIFAFNVALMQTNMGLRFPALECNPRFSGTTYPTLIANKLNIFGWSALTMKTRHRSIADIDLKDIEFDKKTGHGVVLVNWGTVLEGEIVVLLAGTQTYQGALAVELLSRL
jgi:hypothetical protein